MRKSAPRKVGAAWQTKESGRAIFSHILEAIPLQTRPSIYVVVEMSYCGGEARGIKPLVFEVACALRPPDLLSQDGRHHAGQSCAIAVWTLCGMPAANRVGATKTRALSNSVVGSELGP